MACGQPPQGSCCRRLHHPPIAGPSPWAAPTARSTNTAARPPAKRRHRNHQQRLLHRSMEAVASSSSSCRHPSDRHGHSSHDISGSLTHRGMDAAVESSFAAVSQSWGAGLGRGWSPSPCAPVIESTCSSRTQQLPEAGYEGAASAAHAGKTASTSAAAAAETFSACRHSGRAQRPSGRCSSSTTRDGDSAGSAGSGGGDWQGGRMAGQAIAPMGSNRGVCVCV